MLTHTDVWQAIDGLAAAHGCSVSALAKRAGLDSTTFNKSKRVSPQGKLRWPSTESLAKVLQATGDSLNDFVRLAGRHKPGADRRRIPVREIVVADLAEAGTGVGTDADPGRTGSGHALRRRAGKRRVSLPDPGRSNLLALEIGDESLRPLYRDGDILVVSTEAPIRRGDRVVVKTEGGEIIARALARQTARHLCFEPLTARDAPRELPRSEIRWMARILWSSQ